MEDAEKSHMHGEGMHRGNVVTFTVLHGGWLRKQPVSHVLKNQFQVLHSYLIKN